MSEDGYSDYFDEPNMAIQIDTLLGTSFDMRCSSTDTVREIKQRIQRVEGIPVHQQNLIFQSKELKDSHRLCDISGIRNGSTIKLVTSMKGGPISTRRLSSSSSSVGCEHHSMLKELRDLLESTRDEIGDKLAPGSKVSVLVFKEGDILNLLRVIENEDGSYSPYSEKKVISPPILKSGKRESQAIFEKLIEDTDMMTKITNLRKRMEDLNVRRQLRIRETSTSSTNLSYKFLEECCQSDILDSIDLKILEKSPEDTEEVALKDKHRIKPHRKSLFGESKGAKSFTKQNYKRMSHKKVHSDDSSSSSSSKLDFGESLAVPSTSINLTRLVLTDGSSNANSNKSPKSSSTSEKLELEEDLWEMSESVPERLKHSATTTSCKFGLLKRRQSVDYGFDSQPSTSSGGDTDSGNFGVCSGNFFMPQLVSPPSAIPQQYTPKNCDYFYNRSPLYGRNNNNNKSEPVPNNSSNSADVKGGGFLGECSSIQRLKNDSLFGEDDNELYGYYNLGCASELLTGGCDGDDDFDIDSSGGTKDSDITDRLKVELPPVTIKKRARCGECNKRLNITNIYDCRCGRIFCSQHRYSEVHRCSYDYKSEGRRILEHQNPLVTAEKIHRI